MGIAMRQRAHHWLDAYSRHRFAWLFASLLLTLGIDPVLDAVGAESRLLEGFLLLNLLAASAGADSRRVFRTLLVATLGIAVVGPLVALGSTEVREAARWAAIGLVALAASVALLRAVLRPGRVDAERLFAALSVYLLVGIAFGLLFLVLERTLPGSVAQLTAPDANDLHPLSAIYFSFVTFATLGYGDVVPMTAAARALAMLEAVLGQLYVAVLIARLVTLYRSEPNG